MDEELRRLMAQIQAEQGLKQLNEILPQCIELQKVLAMLTYNFYTALCDEGFTKLQAIEIVKAQGTGLNRNSNDGM